MSNPTLKYVSGNTVSAFTIDSSSTVNVTYSSGGTVATLSPVLSTVGQQIFATTAKLSSDFTPSIIVPTTGAASQNKLQTTAIFWSIPYTPQNSNSIIQLRVCLQYGMLVSTTSSQGICAFVYTSSTAGSSPLASSGAVVIPANSSALQYYGQMSGLATYTNSSTSTVTFTLCAYNTGVAASQRIIGANSTATVLGGTIASTAKIIEILN